MKNLLSLGHSKWKRTRFCKHGLMKFNELAVVISSPSVDCSSAPCSLQGIKSNSDSEKTKYDRYYG